MTDKKQKAKGKTDSSTPIPAFPHLEEHQIGEGESEYVVGSWAGNPQCRCQLCAFDTLSGRDVMLRHLVDAHDSEKALVELVKLEEGAKSASS